MSTLALDRLLRVFDRMTLSLDLWRERVLPRLHRHVLSERLAGALAAWLPGEEAVPLSSASKAEAALLHRCVSEPLRVLAGVPRGVVQQYLRAHPDWARSSEGYTYELWRHRPASPRPSSGESAPREEALGPSFLLRTRGPQALRPGAEEDLSVLARIEGRPLYQLAWDLARLQTSFVKEADAKEDPGAPDWSRIQDLAALDPLAVAAAALDSSPRARVVAWLRAGGWHVDRTPGRDMVWFHEDQQHLFLLKARRWSVYPAVLVRHLLDATGLPRAVAAVELAVGLASETPTPAVRLQRLALAAASDPVVFVARQFRVAPAAALAAWLGGHGWTPAFSGEPGEALAWRHPRAGRLDLGATDTFARQQAAWLLLATARGPSPAAALAFARAMGEPLAQGPVVEVEGEGRPLGWTHLGQAPRVRGARVVEVSSSARVGVVTRACRWRRDGHHRQDRLDGTPSTESHAKGELSRLVIAFEDGGVLRLDAHDPLHAQHPTLAFEVPEVTFPREEA